MAVSNPLFILVVSDDASLHLQFNRLLIKQYLNTIHTHSIQSSSQVSLQNNICLILIDSRLLNHERINDCIQLRDVFSNKIAIISNDDNNTFDEAEVLNYGADAYIDGTRSDVVLLANIKALLRQSNEDQKKREAPQDTNPQLISIQDLIINLKTFQATQKNKNLKLTHGEFHLLLILAKHVGEVVKRETLFKELSGTSYTGQSRSLDLRISVLRQKLGDTKAPHQYIKTIRGVGYVLLPDH